MAHYKIIFQVLFWALLKGLSCKSFFSQNEGSWICEDPGQSCGAFIPNLPTKYHAQMLLTLPYENMTKYVVELTDGSKRQSVIKSYSEGILYSSYLNTKEQTRLTLVGSENDLFEVETACHGSSYTFNSMNYFFGTKEKDKTISVAFHNGIINYNEVNMKYIGNSTKVRGIPVHQWQGCAHVEELKATLSIEVFWSVWQHNSVATASGELTVPVKIVIVGEYQPNPTDPPQNIYEIYEIIWFKKLEEYPQEMFELPHGLYCTGLSAHEDFPPIPDKFSMKLESVYEEKGNHDNNNNPINSMTNFDAWYDTEFELVRLEFRTPATDDGQSKKKYAFNTTVLDFRTGVLYNIDKYSTLCDMSLINDAEVVQKFGKVHFQNPKEFFYQEIPISKYEYKGKYKVRDSLCDVWTGQADTSVMNIEWSFLDKSWIEVGLNNIEHSVPVQMVLYSLQDDGNKTYESRQTLNIFNFLHNPTSFPIDVGSCFEENQKRHFRVAFPVPETTLNSKLIELIRERSRFDIADIIKVSPVRTNNVEVNVYPEENLLYIEFTLLGLPGVLGIKSRPDDIALDTAIDNLKYFVHQNSLMVIVYTEETNEPLQLVALSDSLYELESRDYSCEPAKETLPARDRELKQEQKSFKNSVKSTNTIDVVEMDKYSTGQLVGLAIGMFIAGGTIGILAMILLLVRIDRSRRQEDMLQLSQQQSPGETPLTEESITE